MVVVVGARVVRTHCGVVGAAVGASRGCCTMFTLLNMSTTFGLLTFCSRPLRLDCERPPAAGVARAVLILVFAAVDRPLDGAGE